MSGDATFSGTTYQQRVIAYVGVHVLAGARLSWFDSQDDTPESLWAETTGPGDDCAVRLCRTNTVFEVQAKHGLTAGAKLRDTVAKIFAKIRVAGGPSAKVVIAVDQSASRTIRIDVARDLQRLRSGRGDSLKDETKALLDLATDSASLLSGISIVSLDLDQDDGADTKHAILRLEALIEDRAQALTAWHLLVDDAGTVCARRLFRSRADLVALLGGHGIPVKPASAEEHRQLDICRDLLRRWYVSAARELLSSLDAIFAARHDPGIQYRLLQLSANCARLERDFNRAVELALRALDIRPDGLDAIRTAGYAQLQKGDLAAAAIFAEKAVSLHGTDPSAWAMKVHVDAARGVTLAVPPPDVAQSAPYRTAEAQAAESTGDWQKALDLANSLLRDGERSPDVLLLMAECLLSVDQYPTPAQLQDSIRFCSEIVETLHNEDDPRYQRALQLRGNALFESGDSAGAQADAERLRELAGNRPDVLHDAAVIRRQAGDIEGALAILQTKIADEDPMLLALRARLKHEKRDTEPARRDAQSALAKLTAQAPVEAKLAVAEALLDVGDEVSCARILEEPAVRETKHTLHQLLIGRLAFREGKTDVAMSAFRAAANARPASRMGILFELASGLRGAGRAGDAASILGEFKGCPLSEPVQRLFASCLFEANRLADAQELIDDRATQGELPVWALSLALEIARRRDDVEGGLRHLRALVEKGLGGPEARLQLAGLLFEDDRRDEARTEALAVLAQEPLSPIVRTQTALLLAHMKCAREALEAAYRSYREARHDHRVHEGLMLVSQSIRETPTTVDAVAENTYVRLRRGEETREYTILASGVVDPSRGELVPEQAAALGLLGRRVGEVFPLPGGVEPDGWFVDEILGAAHHAVQEAYSRYEKDFPSKNFVRGVPAPTGNTVADVGPLIRVVARKKERDERIMSTYRDQRLPLGLVARAFGVGMRETIARLTADENTPGLLAEWPEPVRQQTSIRCAASAKAVVLARSSLAYAHMLGLLEKLQGNYDLVAPRSLLRSLVEEVREAEELVLTGRTVLGSGDTGLTLQGVEAGHPRLVDHRNTLRGLVEWCRANVRFEPRPLELLEAADDTENSPREVFGHDSWDALELAHDRKAALYADDLGIRRVEYRGAQVTSFSTASLVCALVERNLLAATERDRFLQGLALGHYMCVPLSPDLLLDAIARGAELDRDQLARIFGILPTLPTIGEAVGIAAKTLKAVAVSPVQTMPLRQVVSITLTAMLRGWPAPLIAQQLRQATAAEFLLMPTQLREVDSVCAVFVREHTRPAIIKSV